MATLKQIAANRANAKHSTGPRTDAGRARSRGNAWKHGLTAEDIVIYHEDSRAFEALRGELWEQFAPLPGIESTLVDRLVALEWRLRRVPVLEAAALDTYCVNLADAEARSEAYAAARAGEEIKEQDEEHEIVRRSQQLGQAIINDARDYEVLGKLSRYEAALLSAHARTWEMLLRVQALRQENEQRSRTIDGAPLDDATVTNFRPRLTKPGALKQ